MAILAVGCAAGAGGDDADGDDAGGVDAAGGGAFDVPSARDIVSDGDSTSLPDDGAAGRDSEDVMEGTCLPYPLPFIEPITIGGAATPAGYTAALPDCVGDDPVLEHVLARVRAEQETFDLDPDEWVALDPPIACAAVGERVAGQSPARQRVERVRFGGQPLVAGAGRLTFYLAREDGIVSIVTSGGEYLPRASAEQRDAMAACAPRAPEQLATDLHGADLTFSVYRSCTEFVGMATYRARDGDTVEWDEPPGWCWRCADDRRLRRVRTGRLLIAPQNYTDELLSGTTYCPGTAHEMGFSFTIDEMTGQVLSAVPGIDCIVC